MVWTIEQKRAAAIAAPKGRDLGRDDSQVIDRPDWYQLITPSAPGTMLNEIAFSRLAQDAADRAIDAVIASHQATGRPVKWCVGPWTEPDDMGDRLSRHGFTRTEVRGMGIDTSVHFEVPSGVTVEEVDATTVDEFVATFLRGWSVSKDQSELERRTHRRALFCVPRTVIGFASRVDGEMVGTAVLLLREGYGYLVGAQVFGAARGRGAYRALIETRLAWLRQRGLKYAVTQAREATSAPVLEHLGFETLFRSQVYYWEPSV